MSTATGAPPATGPARTRSWWAQETRVGRYRYPLRAIAVTAAAGASTAVAAVLAAVTLLPD